MDSGFGGVNPSQGRVTRLSKIIAALMVALFAVHTFLPTVAVYLPLTPGKALFQIWSLVTAGFLTTNVLELVASVLALLMLARTIEPIYGSREFLNFIFIADFCSCFATWVVMYAMYAATATARTADDYLYHPFSGFQGIIAALLVSMKQVFPDNEFHVFGFIKLRSSNLPSLFLLLLTVAALVLKNPLVLPFAWFGAYSGWLYLRFFQHLPSARHAGDPDEDFRYDIPWANRLLRGRSV